MSSTINTPRWQNYIESKIGFVLPKTQVRWLSNAILTTAEDSGRSLSELWLAVQTDVRLRQQLLDRVLIVESRFFRHGPSLEYIAALAKEQTVARKQRITADDTLDNRLNSRPQKQSSYRIWSVGCARGQEVWSLAMLLENSGIADYCILGTDVNYEAIQDAQQACYCPREIATIPEDYQHYIQPCDTDGSLLSPLKESQSIETGCRWQIIDALRSKVSFRHHNIFGTKAATHTKQQVIICQNMLIYFRQFDQRDILARFVEQCELGGHIILAPGEALFWQHPKMQRISHPEVNLWQKIRA